VNESKNIMCIACSRGSAWTIAALALLVVAVVPAQAQAQAREQATPAAQGTQDSVGDDFPWGQGVPDADRDRAIAIFLEANVLLEDTLFGRAAAKYEEALKIWDHPAFHYNLALARIHLDQPIAAYENLEQAVRYGPAPLDSPDRYEHALRYLELLRNQLAHVEVTCDQPGARITLDGKPLFTGPGRHQALVLPGGHQIVASAPGRIPATEQLVLAPGQRVAVALVLHEPERTVTVRYMPAWIPWVSLGVGAAVLGVGRYVDHQASGALAAFDVDFNRRCPRGCTEIEAPGFDARLARIGREQTVARGLYAGGGAVVMVSAALLYLNRERVERRADDDTISMMPMAAPGALGLAARVRF
jgi:hypothetical protein